MTKVLLVRLSAMGDLVQSLGAIQALHAARPDWQLHLLTQRPFVPLLEGVDGLASILAHDRRGGLAALLQTRRALRRLGCAVALDLQGNAKSALFAWLSGAKRRVGPAGAWRQERWSALGLSEPVQVAGARHPFRVAMAVVGAVAPEVRPQPPRLVALPDEVERAAARVRALGIDPGRPFRVLALGRAEDPRSQRPAAAEVEARRSPLPTLALLGPDEGDVVPPSRIPCLRQGSGSLRELVGLGVVIARAGGDAVAADQGPLHVLSACGAKVFGLFGPQDPDRTAPPAATVLQHPTPPPCMPCSRMRCRHEHGPVCMQFHSAEGRRWTPPEVGAGA